MLNTPPWWGPSWEPFAAPLASGLRVGGGESSELVVVALLECSDIEGAGIELESNGEELGPVGTAEELGWEDAIQQSA